MRPLRPGDPDRVGPYRTLARLGAGGMGTVYLARAPGGAVAAVKIIHTGRASDPDYRARFRREVAAARSVDSPWTAPLLAADPDGPAPWLATAYVPGPSLGETVETHGPLPERTVRLLGARLAHALGAVHRAGLVHRDVKPGNVLLTLDGPRLIDFGIARSSDATALTATGAIIGSPGFLAPEQARSRREEIGPPCDVFSLGCVLAYAATGTRPFGGGLAAAALLRTVTEEPDLDGAPPALLALLTACLRKAPADRPTADEVRRTLTPADQPPHGRPALGDRAPDPGAPWLPDPVTRLVADRAALALRTAALPATEVPARPSPALPAPAPSISAPSIPAPSISSAETVTAVPARDPEEPAADGTPRRRLLTLGPAALAAAGAAWWYAGHPRTGTRGGRAEPDRPTLTIALHQDLSGPARALGRAQRDGARIAADHLNAETGHPFRIALAVHDDTGSPERSAALAARLVADRSVRAVVGPTTDACALAAVRAYHAASLPTAAVSPGADANHLIRGDTRPRAYIPVRPLDTVMAAPCRAYLTLGRDCRRVTLLDDRTQGELGYELCQRLSDVLLDSGREARIRRVPAELDAPALAAAVLADRADGLLFTGDQRRTAALARALAAAGYRGARMGLLQGYGPEFTAAAGPAAEGWVFTTPFVDAARTPAARKFTAAYRKRFGASPPAYAPEAYDAVLFLAEAMASGDTVVEDRGSIVRRTRDLRYRGVTRTLAYSASRGGDYDAAGLFLYRVSGGRYDFLGQYMDAVGTLAD
ncbi:bifunctional serine/threonine-protein kinase/ABC transporter substrate-binding protein [Streptomyces sp. NPDC046887]|uniref:bifunctional serine/threonine-protein kinase/ABC transporter substrate-binding protein n=1 Tax=Streptomyces sp. NPDC046887 TaxID=3155472 RepID=UPI0033FF1914